MSRSLLPCWSGRASLAALAVAFSVCLAAAPAAQDKKDKDKETEPDVVFVPSPQEVVDRMLEVAKVTEKDVVYDLGCGDGIIVCTAAKKYRCKAYGCDVDPERVKESNANRMKL